jgi:hypothetical protein
VEERREILSDQSSSVEVGVTRPNLDPDIDYAHRHSTDGWFISTNRGGLWGNGKENDDAAGNIDEGDRVGVLLDLDEGSLRFFVNGVQHGPGYPAGSVTGPVVCAVQLPEDAGPWLPSVRRRPCTAAVGVAPYQQNSQQLMAFKEAPMVWRTCDEEKVTLSEDGAVATNVDNEDDPDTLVTSGVELTAGKHYWEVEILSDQSSPIVVGVTRPNLNPDSDCGHRDSAEGWFIDTYEGCLFGNGTNGGDPPALPPPPPPPPSHIVRLVSYRGQINYAHQLTHSISKHITHTNTNTESICDLSG